MRYPVYSHHRCKLERKLAKHRCRDAKVALEVKDVADFYAAEDEGIDDGVDSKREQADCNQQR